METKSKHAPRIIFASSSGTWSDKKLPDSYVAYQRMGNNRNTDVVKELEQYLSALTSENERLKEELKKYEWISVKDRLPGKHDMISGIDEVLAYTGMYSDRLIVKFRGGKFLDALDYSDISQYVIRWMPLLNL